MNLTYPEIFAVRGRSYDSAMRRYPDARRAEFEALFARVPVRASQRVLDVPAGGGYLPRFLPWGAKVTALELTDGFGGNLPPLEASLDVDARYEHAVCLAALHHIPSPMTFLAQVMGRLAPGGTLHIADVRAGSPLALFLDGFVGRFNGTGHVGTYLADDAGQFAQLGTVTRCSEVPCPWMFDSRLDMLTFCSELFGMRECPDDALEDALATYVGWRDVGKSVVLDWRLLYVDILAN